jgi:hypothetical protein
VYESDVKTNAIKPVPPTLGGALRRDQGQIIEFLALCYCWTGFATPSSNPGFIYSLVSLILLDDQVLRGDQYPAGRCNQKIGFLTEHQ